MPQMAPSAWLLLYAMFLVSLLAALSVVYFTENLNGSDGTKGELSNPSHLHWVW